jgi:hypothetical protein
MIEDPDYDEDGILEDFELEDLEDDLEDYYGA